MFRLVAAVVTEHGGVLCHAAIVAREYRIPAVLGVDRAMSCLADDEHVTVDGGHGTIAPATEQERLPE